jgi:hypothetical protein
MSIWTRLTRLQREATGNVTNANPKMAYEPYHSASAYDAQALYGE